MNFLRLQFAPDQPGPAGGGGGAPLNPQALRLQELQLDRALFGLSADEEAELHVLLDEAGLPLDQSFEMTAAALDRALAPTIEPLPKAIHDRVLAVGQTWAAQRRSEEAEHAAEVARDGARRVRHGVSDRVVPGDTSMRLGWRAWGGWLCAAACLTLAIVSWNRTGTSILNPGPGGEATGTGTASLGSAVDKVFAKIKGAKDTKASELVKQEELTGPPPIAADVYWSDELQTGVLVLTGLPAIKCPGDVYQLWITDALRDEQYPVDGGTFRVENGQTEVKVIITPRVRVDCATQFTITKERAGGVVVSDRRSIVAVGEVGEDLLVRFEPVKRAR